MSDHVGGGPRGCGTGGGLVTDRWSWLRLLCLPCSIRLRFGLCSERNNDTRENSGRLASDYSISAVPSILEFRLDNAFRSRLDGPDLGDHETNRVEQGSPFLFRPLATCLKTHHLNVQ